MRHVFAVVLMATATAMAAPRLHAQAHAGLAGTWVLTQEGGGRGRGAGIPGVPLATEVTIKVTPAEVIVDTNTGSAQTIQTAVYKLDGGQTTVPGPLGWTVTATAAWKDSMLVVNTIRSLEGPNGPIGAEIVDVYTAAPDILTIVRTQGRNKQTLVYKKKS